MYINWTLRDGKLKKESEMTKPNCSPVLLLFLTPFFLSVFHIHARKDHSCPPTTCSFNGPEIRFPFRLKHESPPNCGYPHQAFELSCNGENETVLHIWSSSSDQLIVNKINYKEAKIELSTPDDCLPAFFLSHNLSQSPFRFSYPTNRTVMNCSKEVEGFPYEKVPCLSSFNHNVYIVYSDEIHFVAEMPLYCHSVKTVELDARLMYERSLDLRWEIPLCGRCQGGSKRCYTKNMITSEMGCHGGIQKEYIIIGVPLGLFGVVIAVAIGVKAYCILKYSKIEKEYQLKVEKFLEDYKSLKPTRYTFHEIKRMTNNFKNKLGEGGYGSVFKGEIPNGMLVAVKLLHSCNSFADGDEFVNEVGTIGRIHHVNVVRLLGFCAENLKRALIYEFLPNESLEKFIFYANSKAPFLGWEKLQEIAIGIARGIEYLHQGCDCRILHFDIKPHNILLDDGFTPKVSDFGLAKLCSKGQSIVSVTAARGTMGYIAPEVFSRNFGNVSYKSDVYSFGMLLLEMVGGRKNIDTNVEDVSRVYFPEWIYKQLDGGNDSRSEDVTQRDGEIAKKLSIVGLWCIQWYPLDRPSMQSVVQMLEGSTESLTVPPCPFNSSSSNPETAPRKPHFSQLSVISE